MPGSGAAGTGTLTVVTAYQVQFKPTLTLLRGASAFNGNLSIAGKVVGIFTLTGMFKSSNGETHGMVAIGSFAGQPVTETIFANCFPTDTSTVVLVFLIGPRLVQSSWEKRLPALNSSMKDSRHRSNFSAHISDDADSYKAFGTLSRTLPSSLDSTQR